MRQKLPLPISARQLMIPPRRLANGTPSRAAHKAPEQRKSNKQAINTNFVFVRPILRWVTDSTQR